MSAVTSLYPDHIRCGSGAEALISLQGDVDLLSADRLTRTLRMLAGQNLRVVVDLSDVRYLDSSGIVALQRGYLALGGGLRVCGCPQRLRRIFRILRLEHLLSVS